MMNCWLHKLRSFAGGHAMEEHARHCSRCRAELAENAAMETRLRNSHPSAEAPFGFAHRVLSKTEREGKPRMTSEVVGFDWMPITAGAALIVAGLVAIYQVSSKRQFRPTVERTSPTPKQEEQVLANLPKISPAQFQQLTVKLDQPLENELQYMISDTRQAIQFVASNFIPDER